MRSTAVGGLSLMLVLEWLRHQLSDAVSEGLARSAMFFGELEANVDGVTA